MGRFRIYNGKTKTESYEGYHGKIVEYPLRPSVNKWVLDALSSGKGLSHALIEVVDFSQGSWIALLPEDTPEEVANESINSGVFPEPPPDTWVPLEEARLGTEMTARVAQDLGCWPQDLIIVPKPSLVPFVAEAAQRFLKEGSDRVCFVEDTAASASALPTRSEPRPWVCGDDVFYAILDWAWDIERIADVIDNASNGWRQTLIYTTLPVSMIEGLDSRDSLSQDELSELALSASSVIVEAYDGESYLRWRP